MKTKDEVLRALNYLKENECKKQQYYNCENCPHDKWIIDNKDAIMSVCPHKRNYDYVKNFIDAQFNKENYYKWHNLREDPNDLPKNEVVNICYETKLGYAYSSAIYNGIKWVLEEADEYLCANNDVLAWKYIEEFE